MKLTDEVVRVVTLIQARLDMLLDHAHHDARGRADELRWVLRLLGDPAAMREDFRAQMLDAQVTLATWTPLRNRDDLTRRYGDKDAAEVVSRAVMYLDIGYLVKQVEDMSATLEQLRGQG